MLARKPYSGPRKLVLAFDVGTTYSGISYCILQPGQIPEIRGVTKQSLPFVFISICLDILLGFLARRKVAAMPKYPPFCTMTPAAMSKQLGAKLSAWM